MQTTEAIRIVNLQIIADDSYLSDDVKVENVVPIRQSKKYVMDLHTDSDLFESEIYDEEQMKLICMGIVQNIAVEMDKQNFNLASLARNSGLSNSHVCRVLNGQQDIGLKSMIKMAAALHINPASLFPLDSNSRKTNGQRFDDITKGLPIQYSNYFLEMVAGMCNLYRSSNKDESYYSNGFDGFN